jgi:hypothetical protein
MVQYLLSVLQALGSILSTEKNKKEWADKSYLRQVSRQGK